MNPTELTFFAAHHPYVHRLLDLGLLYAANMEMAGPMDPIRERFLYQDCRALFAREEQRLMGAPKWQFDSLGRVRLTVRNSIVWTLDNSLGSLAHAAGMQWWQFGPEEIQQPLDYLLAWWVLPCPWLVAERPCDIYVQFERETVRALITPSHIHERGTPS